MSKLETKLKINDKVYKYKNTNHEICIISGTVIKIMKIQTTNRRDELIEDVIFVVNWDNEHGNPSGNITEESPYYGTYNIYLTEEECKEDILRTQIIHSTYDRLKELFYLEDNPVF